MTNFENLLNSHLNELLSFARTRLNKPQLAADVVQDSLLKAMKAKETLDNKSNIRAWLFRILRNTIIDLYRKNRDVIVNFDPDSTLVEEEVEKLACTCIEKLLPTLNKDYAFIIKELELNEKSTTEIAIKLNIKPNNLKVKRYRARQQLKQRLEETCRLCAKHGCLNCDCKSE